MTTGRARHAQGQGIRQVLGVQGMVIEDVTVQTDPDGDEEILVVFGAPDARSAGVVRRVAGGAGL